MSNLITYKGKIQFDPINLTKKHINQSDWKRVAMIMFDGDICEYYAWFIFKRYNLKLNKPLRGAHISFINDSLNDIKKGLGIISDDEANKIWNSIRNKYDGKNIDVTLNLNMDGDGKHIWLIVDHDYREEIHNIRKELGLHRPYFGLHMSIGYSNERNMIHSKYVNKIMKFEKQKYHK